MTAFQTGASMHEALLEGRPFCWISEGPYYWMNEMENAPRCASCGVNTYLMGCFCNTEANRTHPCGPDPIVSIEDPKVELNWYGDRDPQEVDQGCGEYDGTSCELCGRERVMIGGATGRRICEKCGWYQDTPLPAGPDMIIGDTMCDLKTYSSHELFIAGRTSGKMLAWAGALAASGILIITESHRIEEARQQMKAMRFDDVRLDPVTYDLLVRDQGFELKTMMAPLPPENPGRRYGPYDADPHTKGRRRRFRPQRRS